MLLTGWGFDMYWRRACVLLLLYCGASQNLTKAQPLRLLGRSLCFHSMSWVKEVAGTCVSTVFFSCLFSFIVMKICHPPVCLYSSVLSFSSQESDARGLFLLLGSSHLLGILFRTFCVSSGTGVRRKKDVRRHRLVTPRSSGMSWCLPCLSVDTGCLAWS